MEIVLSRQGEDILTEEQELRMKKGFEQIAEGEYITANNYVSKRGLTKGDKLE